MMCLFFWLQTIPARSTIPLYSRLIEAYIVHALAGVLRFVRVEPTERLQFVCHCRRARGKWARRAASHSQIVAIKGLCRRAAGKR